MTIRDNICGFISKVYGDTTVVEMNRYSDIVHTL